MNLTIRDIEEVAKALINDAIDDVTLPYPEDFFVYTQAVTDFYYRIRDAEETKKKAMNGKEDEPHGRYL